MTHEPLCSMCLSSLDTNTTYFNGLIGNAHVFSTGESVPSIVVLWVMRDLPPRSCDNSMNGRVTSQEVLIQDALVPDPNYLSRLVSSAGQRYLQLPSCCNSDVSPS